MSQKDGMLSVRDDRATFKTLPQEAIQAQTDAVGRLLENFRTYLTVVASKEIDKGFRAKLGASDAVQQTYVEAHRDWSKFRGQSIDDLRSWLRGMLLNTIRDAARACARTKRRAGREVPFSQNHAEILIDPDPTPGSAACAKETAVSVTRALARLSAEYREVIELRCHQNLPFKEIGRIMGRSDDAARMLLFRAIEQLRGELTNVDTI